MFKLKRLLSVVTSAAIAASMLSAFSVTAGAFDESISYADGKVTATAAGKLIAASYNESGALAEVKLYDVEADTPIDVEVSEGDKLMLWSGVDGETMVPLTEAYTVEAPAESTDAPTAPPEVESVTYLEEDFNSYSSTGTTAQGTEAQQAELGDVILYVGNRGSGGDGKTGVSLEDGALKIVSERYATSSRGVSIAVNADKVTIPAFGEIEDGAVINYEFKMKFTDSASTVQMMGVTDNTTTPGGQVVNDPYLSVANNSNIPLNEWVSVCVGVDNQKNGTVIIKDADGKLVSTASFTAVGDSLVKFAFYGGITTVYMDDLSIKKAEKAYGSFEGVVKNRDGDAIEDASITVERFKVKTGADGKAAFVLPNGEYDVIASKSGYEHTKGMQDNDTTSVTVNNDVRSAEFELSPMSYDKIPETVNIENGQAFVSAPKTAETNETAAFTVSVFDQYGIKVEDSSEYTLTWDVYPAGTTTADGVVSISEDGVVSVSKDFNPSGDISEYDVTATVVMNNAGLRGQTVKKSIYVGKNDVIYYEPIAWSEAAGARGNTKNLASAVALPDISSVTLDLTMQEPEGQRTLFLVTDTGNFVGIQYQKATSSIVAGTGWSGNSGLNQSGDVDKFTNQETLIEGYTSNTPFEVTFVIDKTTDTVTVSSGTSIVSLPFVAASPASFTGFKTGLYRSYGAMTMSSVMVKEPDNNYLSISGDLDFAKVSGMTVTREYALSQSVIVPDETFAWSVSPEDQGVTVDENGVLSVEDTATVGSYALTATSSINEEKTATVNIEIGDFQLITAENAVIEGAHAYSAIAESSTFRLAKLTDSYGDDVTKLLPAAVWSSSDESVATIDAETGELIAQGYGTATITATVTNGTAVSAFEVPITVARYFIIENAYGDTTEIDSSNLISDPAITGYVVTTSKEGKLIKQETVAAVPTSVDTTGADAVEITPVFTYKNITATNPVNADLPSGTYNFSITGASGKHFDPYVNDQMLANNMLQGGSAVNYIKVNDIVVDEGYMEFNLRDADSDSKMGQIEVSMAPFRVERTKKVYVLGDSLVCIYANGGDAAHNYQTGWGQVLQSYLTDEYEVVDLGNSGVTAEGLADSAITQVAMSGTDGDVMILESGYNDRTYTTQPKMTEAVKYMYNAATENGVDTVLVSPNASQHDYKSSPAWGSLMMSIADELGAKKIDLAGLSYSFLYGTYGDNVNAVKATYNVSDGLHSTYNGAHKMASIVAGGLIDVGLGDMVNTEYVYTFTDTLGNTITCQAASSN